MRLISPEEVDNALDDRAMAEGGDIAIPLASGAITAADIQGDLFDLTRGGVTGRTQNQAADITLFKSVGTGLEDLAAAQLVMQNS